MSRPRGGPRAPRIIHKLNAYSFLQKLGVNVNIMTPLFKADRLIATAVMYVSKRTQYFLKNSYTVCALIIFRP